MPEYETVWSCYVEGDSPEDAALVAKATLQDPGNLAWGIAVDDGQTVFHYDVEDSAEPFEWTEPTRKMTVAVWNSCEACGSHNINADSLSADGTVAYGQVTCDDCGAYWTEVFKASHREGLNE